MRSAKFNFWRFRSICTVSQAVMLGVFVCASLGADDIYAEDRKGSDAKMTHEATEASVVQTVWGILGYSRWPDHPGNLQLCIIGDTAYADALMHTPATTTGRHVDVRRIEHIGPGAAQGCHAIYAGAMPQKQWQQWIAQRPSEAGLLTINEKHDACPQDSIFCLDLSQKSVGFELNLDAMARSGVKVSPRVFGLSKRKEAP